MISAHFRVSFFFLALFTFLASLISAEAHAFPKARQQRTEYAPINQPSWYVAVNGSMNFVSDATLHETGGTGLSGTVSFDDGYGASAALGHSFGVHNSMVHNIRVELEQSYRSNKAAKFIPNAGTSAALDDEMKMQTTMANVYADFDSGGPMKPYVGLGLGMGRMSLNSTSLNVNSTEAVFAYQAMAGITYQPSSMHNTGFTFGYRYLGAADPTFSSSINSKVDVEYAAHILELGTRLRF